MENTEHHHTEHPVEHPVSHVSEHDKILNERKQKVMSFFKQKTSWIYYALLAVVIWFGGIFIRTANMPYLRDITTGTWTLAPDLDPYLFLRWAKYIAVHGSLYAVDMFRYVPLGFKTGEELPVVSYIIAYLYKFLHLFSSSVTVDYAAVISPVIFFCLAMAAFYIFVRQVFIKYKNPNLIALISTLILAVIPGFLHRTIAGVPEKEAHAFVFMFLAFYFIIKAWRSDNWKKSTIFGALAGVSTGLMGLAWGGVSFIFISVALSALVAFFASDFKFKDKMAYYAWIIVFTAIFLPLPRLGPAFLFGSTVTLIAYFVSALFLFDSLLFGTKLHEKLKLEKIKLPKKAVSLLGLVVVGLILMMIVDPHMIAGTLSDIYSNLFKSFETDRFQVTVAENAKPYFDSWSSSFGNLFWIFFLGSILLFYEEIKHFDKRQKWSILTAYVIMIFGVVFTRYSPTSSFNGESLISNILFVGSMLLFAGTLIYEYLKKEHFEVDIGLIFILATFFFALITARGAVRLLYFLYPIAPIIASFTIVRLGEMALDHKENTMRIALGILAVATVLVSAYSVYQFANDSYNEARYGEIPSAYTVQWQLAMNWTRNNTPQDAVFSHWWDYGYWVQSIGERATVLDGGNAMGDWDYLMGRYVLTAYNEQTMLEFMKTHNSSYLLIDSSDIGKYPAFSSIGSDENCSEYSWIPTFTTDTNNIVERRNETVYQLKGGTMLDEDLTYNNQIYPKENSGVGLILISVQQDNSTVTFNQPQAILVSSGKQIQVPIKCAYFSGKKITFGSGIDGCVYIMPEVTQTGVQSIGGALWLSPRLMRSEFSKLYLFNETQNFELVHSENSPIINELNSHYNLNLPEFALYNGQLLGPIKIWKASFPSDTKTNPDFLNAEFPNQLLATKVCR